MNLVPETGLEPALWDVIEVMPCRVRLLKVPRTEMDFHDFEEFEKLLTAAQEVDPRASLIVLLGGDAGLRCGEMLALEWTDIDLKRQPPQLKVERSDWRGNVTSTKGMAPRRIPLTKRLATALRAHKHLRGQRVLCREDGSPLRIDDVRTLVRRAARKAGLKQDGIHILRHTFCSHLAMRGATVKAVQELAGHKDLQTTLRYMHLSPTHLVEAIRLLESTRTAPVGDILETAGAENLND